MSCESCQDAERDRFYQRQSVIKKAQDYAIQHSVEVALYAEAGGYLGYIRYSVAVANRIPVLRVISYLQDADNG